MSGSNGTTEAALPHGGNLGEAKHLFPNTCGPWVDLSTGINPWAYPLPPIPAEAWTNLPAPGAASSLEAAAAACYGVPSPAHVVVTPGTQAAIQWLPRLFAPASVAILGPTYGEHARGWALAGHQVREVVAVGELEAATIAVVVNPNNPDGRALDARALLRLAASKHERGGALIVDEAFADTMPDISVAGQAGTPGLVVLRSFGKFFGLAGIRLGFVLADSKVARGLREALGPWAVSGEALAIGRTALADRDWQRETRARLAGASTELDAILAPVGRIVGGTDLFRLIETQDAARWFDKLGKAGLWVRRFPFNAHWLRFGLPPDGAACQRLRAVCGM